MELEKIYPFKYETHMHTSASSACGCNTPEEMVEAYKNAGYAGIIITDHHYGGNTAIDAVRTAVRLGAEKVTLIYRRTENEMPAEPDEIRDAKAEGVEFKFLASPLEVIGENGKVKGIKLQNMQLGEPDSSGRRSPVAIDGSTEILECDTVISAIGQRVVAEDLDSVELTRKSTISVDEKTYMTSVSGVFAAGDVINKGPDIAIRAIAGGKYAARSIDCYLNGIEVPSELPDYSVNKNFDASVLDGTPAINRCEVKLQDADIRKKNFGEAAFTFTKEDYEYIMTTDVDYVQGFYLGRPE